MTPSSPRSPAPGVPPNGPSPWLTQARTFVGEIIAATAADAGARAALRSGVGKGLDDVPRMHRIVAPRLPPAVLNDESGQRAFYTVAALIAAYHRPTTTGPGQKPDEVPGTKAEDAESDQLLAADAGASQASGPTRSTDNADRTQEPVSATEAAQQRRDRFGESLGSSYATAVAAGPRHGIRESAAETRLNLLSKQSTSGVHRHLPATARQLCDRNTPPDWARLLVDLRSWPHERRRVARRWLQDYHRSLNAAALETSRRADDAAHNSHDAEDEASGT
ncbi:MULTISPECIES: type I-E CRISPR-associated protein Cse2/CasB [Streptomyces]|uniref:type I-E CRISPR-associated protein Cse2/CasB n=1 Tax=Streptomyces TaxID=1883 RepID=UPI00155853C1|nr:type I-E CRISPR-associated protein Cse2/CasB [Streptomyces kasugaensis]